VGINHSRAAVCVHVPAGMRSGRSRDRSSHPGGRVLGRQRRDVERCGGERSRFHPAGPTSWALPPRPGGGADQRNGQRESCDSGNGAQRRRVMTRGRMLGTRSRLSFMGDRLSGMGERFSGSGLRGTTIAGDGSRSAGPVSAPAILRIGIQSVHRLGDLPGLCRPIVPGEQSGPARGRTRTKPAAASRGLIRAGSVASAGARNPPAAPLARPPCTPTGVQ